MKISLELENFDNEEDLEINDTLYELAEIVFAEEVAKQYFPFRTGNLQNVSTHIQQGDNYAEIVSSNPYARRLYYHPEFNFYRGKNANAGGKWHDKITEKFIENTFKNLL